MNVYLVTYQPLYDRPSCVSGDRPDDAYVVAESASDAADIMEARYPGKPIHVVELKTRGVILRTGQ